MSNRYEITYRDSSTGRVKRSSFTSPDTIEAAAATVPAFYGIAADAFTIKSLDHVGRVARQAAVKTIPGQR